MALPVENWMESVEKTGWLGHLESILKAACMAVSALESGNSVVVHCSDGWDRTSQIVRIAAVVIILI